MLNREIMSLLHAWHNIWDFANTTIADNVLTEDFRDDAYSEYPRGPSGTKMRAQEQLAKFYGFVTRIDVCVAQGEKIASHWTATGIRRPDSLVSSTEAVLNISRGIEFFQMCKGKIAIHWEITDVLTPVRNQLGGPIRHSSMDRSPNEERQSAMALIHWAFPDLVFAPGEEIREGVKFARRWTAFGTHINDFVTIPPTGKRVRISGMTISDGHQERYDYFDARSLLAQLGSGYPKRWRPCRGPCTLATA